MKHLPLADIKAIEAIPAFPPALKAEWLRILRTTIPSNSTYITYDNSGQEPLLMTCCGLGGLMHILGIPNMQGMKQSLFAKFPGWEPYLQRVEDAHSHEPSVYDGRNAAIAYIEAHF